MIASPSRPVDLLRLPSGDVLLLPAVWPVRLTPADRRWLAAELLDDLEEDR